MDNIQVFHSIHGIAIDDLIAISVAKHPPQWDQNVLMRLFEMSSDAIQAFISVDVNSSSADLRIPVSGDVRCALIVLPRGSCTRLTTCLQVRVERFADRGERPVRFPKQARASAVGKVSRINEGPDRDLV